MKKRAMKKWIPKNTSYCYIHDKKGNFEVCKWHRTNSKHSKQENGYCIYLGIGDWQNDGMSLLWDSCKECSHKYN